MSDAILVALITSAVTLFGVILANSKAAAVTNNEIKHLTEEVKKHNNFAQRMPMIAAANSLIERRGRNMKLESLFEPSELTSVLLAILCYVKDK